MLQSILENKMNICRIGKCRFPGTSSVTSSNSRSSVWVETRGVVYGCSWTGIRFGFGRISVSRQGITSRVSKSVGYKGTLERCLSTYSHEDMSVQTGAQQPRDHAVAVVTTVGCPYCKKVKEALTRSGIEYFEIDMTDRGQVLGKCKELTGWGTVPQVFVGGSFVGGASETVELIEDGSFRTMVEETGGVSVYAPQQLDDMLFSSAAASTFERASEYFDSALALKKIQNECQTDKNGTLDMEELKLRLRYDPSLVSRMIEQKIVVEQTPGTFVWSSTIPMIAGNVCKTPLNSHIHARNDSRGIDPLETSETLRLLALLLYDEYMSPDGSRVDYAGLAKDERFRIYVDATTDLQNIDLTVLKSLQDRMCFWINMYNALIVHALVVFGPATSTLQRLTWFGDVSYTIGGYRFSANDIEHGVLRGNASNPASLWNILGVSCLAQPIFPPDDPRRQFALPTVDPRIHFALNCGAKSCPPIKVYSPDRLEEGLRSSAEAFCSSEVVYDKSTKSLILSSIFKWYGADFGATQKERLQYIMPYVSKETREALQQMPEDMLDSIHMEYSQYDWSTNSS